MADTIFTASSNYRNPPVVLSNVVGMRKADTGGAATIVFILNVNNNVVWDYYNADARNQDYDRLINLPSCCGGGGELRDLTEINETFENLISGNSVVITNYQSGDIVLVHRNGLFRRPEGVDYTRSGNTITFSLPFGSSSGGLGDGETVSILSLRQ